MKQYCLRINRINRKWIFVTYFLCFKYYIQRNLIMKHIFGLKAQQIDLQCSTKLFQFFLFRMTTSNDKTESELGDSFLVRAKRTRVIRELSSEYQIKCSKHRQYISMLLPVWCYLILDKKRKRNAHTDDSSALMVWRDKK